MAKENLGTCTCPVCGFIGADVREASTGKAYIMCDECSVQIFARGVKSDRAIRAAMRKDIEGAAVPQKKIAPAVAAVAKGEGEKLPAPQAAAADPLAAALADSEALPEEEKTIFDWLLKKPQVAK